MSFDGTGEPELGDWNSKPTGLNWTPGAVTDLQIKRIARNASQPRDWRRRFGSHGSVMNPLDALRHQRSSGAAKPPGRQAASSPLA